MPPENASANREARLGDVIADLRGRAGPDGDQRLTPGIAPLRGAPAACERRHAAAVAAELAVRVAGLERRAAVRARDLEDGSHLAAATLRLLRVRRAVLRRVVDGEDRGAAFMGADAPSLMGANDVRLRARPTPRSRARSSLEYSWREGYPRTTAAALARGTVFRRPAGRSLHRSADQHGPQARRARRTARSERSAWPSAGRVTALGDTGPLGLCSERRRRAFRCPRHGGMPGTRAARRGDRARLALRPREAPAGVLPRTAPRLGRCGADAGSSCEG